MAKIEGQGPLSSTKQTPWILKVCTHYSGDFCPNVTEIRPVSPNLIELGHFFAAIALQLLS